MYKLIFALLTIFIGVESSAKECSPLLDFNVRTLSEKTIVNLCEEYQGRVILIVNTASRCAYTDQYDSLEKLYKEYKDEGFVVLGFPSNDFGHQEPGTEQEIRNFCRLTYGVDFPMFAKTRVSERYADPLYKELGRVSGTYPQWNFHKYLIDRNGKLVADFSSSVDPLDKSVTTNIKQQIKKF
jgi:glutathione peroxidase